MCGIVALFEYQKKGLDLSVIELMAHLISHRGPDDEGYVFFCKGDERYMPTPFFGKDTPDHVKSCSFPYSPQFLLNTPSNQYPVAVLGHRRLSVIDLSAAGHQPMSSPDQRYWIVFNGEIYNHNELRIACEQKGYIFNSQSDTEVIIASYHFWGKDCVTHLSGMWAFIIVDTYEKTVFISRDRFGIKPLYYWHSPNGVLAFASEIKSFTCIPGWSASLNMDRALDFLIIGMTDHTNETLFKNIFQLRGGESCFFSLDDIPDKLVPYRWYNLKRRNILASPETIISDTRELVIKAVSDHLESDVPIGACLSGGIDSTTIVVIGSMLEEKVGHQRIKETFTVVHPGYPDNEEESAIKTSDLLHLSNYQLSYAYGETLKNLDHIIWHLDEPFKSTSILSQWNLFQLISNKKFKVVLDGQGPDELLGGYPVHLPIMLLGLLAEKHYLRFFRELIMGFRYLSLYSTLKGNIEREIVSIISRKMSFSLGRKKDIVTQFIHPVILSLYDQKQVGSITQYNYRDIQGLSFDLVFRKSLPMLLKYEDRNSMAHSIESRIPFLDPDVAEYMINTPIINRISHGFLKYSLRKSFWKELPPHVRDKRKKIGFVAPEKELFSDEFHDWLVKELEKTVSLSNGLIDHSIIKFCEQIYRKPEKYQGFLWRVILFGRWISIFKVRS